MKSATIESLHRYSNRFLRSTDLVRDFRDPKGLDGYWLTDFGKACLERIGEGFHPDSGRRAWRLTGDFGSGKSSFALLLANAFSDPHRKLPKPLRGHVFKSLPEAKRSNFVPLLIVGSRESMTRSILKSLQTVLSELYTRGSKSSLDEEIEKAIRSRKLADKHTLDLLNEANAKIIQTGKGDGLILILDEVGKFLEYAAVNPEQQDVFFLQQLAEMATRSGKQPLMVICLLHQGFNAYAEQLAQASQREWDKVASRFDEIVFHQPLDQVASLIGSALNTNVSKLPPGQKKSAHASMSEAIKLGWYGTSANRDTLVRIPDQLYPLDPTVVPVLVRVFQRYGQNERSLFSFLCSHEPFGMRAFSQQTLTADTQPFRLYDFYDYVRANFGYRLGVASYRTHWNVIESTIEAYNPNDALELRVLKTVGILNLLNVDDLRPTRDAICLAVVEGSANEKRKVREILDRLAEKRVLFFRGESRGYSLWPYTSVDIESRLEAAKKKIPTVASISNVVTEQLDARPVVARAHYIRTGNLRYFDVVYCSPDELEEKATAHKTNADGFILVPLCETDAESKQCKARATKLDPREDLIRLVAVPRALSHLNLAALDALRWEWVQEETPELNNDRFAREEVHLHRQEASNRLQSQIQQFVGLNRISGQSSLTWYFHELGDSQEVAFKSGRAVLHKLADLCDNAYYQAPQIKNELINRHNLSSAAAAARMRLIDLMFANQAHENLGLPTDRKPPEKSMYLSVLKAAHLHRNIDGAWKIAIPTKKQDTSSIRHVLQKIHSVIAEQPDTRVSIQELMELLRKPPYGLRDGLFPILLAVVAISEEQEVAFYENGTFLREVGKDAFLRMTKNPEKFDIQYCKIEGLRGALFKQLAEVLEVSGKDQEVALLDVVRNLCQFVAQLPDHVRQTKQLGSITLAVRDVILQAREPVRMVFHDLPEACGFEKFEIGKPGSNKNAGEFVQCLKQSLDELRSAFPNLQSRMETAIAKEFGYGKVTVRYYRRKLADRAEQLLVRIRENKLKAFAFRIFDETLPESDWLNSVGSVLALRPPDKWKDEDEETFRRELEAAAGRFKRAESAAFATGDNKKAGHGLRVAITRADGTERQEVLHIGEDEEKLLMKLEGEISSLMKKHDRLGIAAASRAIWSQLEKQEEQS